MDDVWTDEQGMDGWMGGQVDNGLVNDGWTDEQGMDGQTDESVDRQWTNG